MTGRLSFIAALAVCAIAAPPAFATTFPSAPGDESEQSFGRFDILVASLFQPGVIAACGGSNVSCGSSLAGYQDHTFTKSGTTFLELTSPQLFDPSTMIGVSGPVFTEGSPSDTGGVPVGNLGTIVKDSSIGSFPPGFEAAGANEAHTQVVSFNMPNGATSVKAGPVPGVSPPSFGEVESPTTTATADGKSFFNLSVNIGTPILTTPLFNTAPLVVEGFGLASLPPTVVYTHTPQTGFVHLFFTEAGTTFFFGDAALAGHGIGFTAIDPTFFNAEEAGFNAYNAANGLPALTPCPPSGCTTDPFFAEQAIVDQFAPVDSALIPEPGTLALLGTGLLVLAGAWYRRRQP